MADAYYDGLLAGYRERRDVLLPALEAAGFRVHRPAGAYYAMTDIRDLTDEDDVDVRPPPDRRPGRGRACRARRSSRDPSSAGRSSGSRSRSGSRRCAPRPSGWPASAPRV